MTSLAITALSVLDTGRRFDRLMVVAPCQECDKRQQRIDHDIGQRDSITLRSIVTSCPAFQNSVAAAAQIIYFSGERQAEAYFAGFTAGRSAKMATSDAQGINCRSHCQVGFIRTFAGPTPGLYVMVEAIGDGRAWFARA